MELPNVRIRGIYATALSALLSNHGYRVVEASPLIAERLGLPADGRPDLRLRDRADRQGLRLEGPTKDCERVARALAELLPDAVPRPPRGPAGWEVELPGGAKARLDRERAAVWPTLPGHHQLKIVAGEAVDRAEQELAAGRRSAAQLAGELRQRYLTATLEPGRDVQVAHVKPDGRELRLPGRIESLRDGRLRLSRRFRPGGSYDSLDQPKLAGDVGEVEQLEGSWVSRRRYLRASGALIGELYNIQTPTEFYPTGVRYLDLEVDVAAWPDGRVEVVDRADLREAVERGYLTPSLGQRALEVAVQVAEQLPRREPVALERWRGSLE
jgi:hypothetical protein